MSERYKVVTWHGEGRSLFYVVDTAQPESEQPCVVETFSTEHDSKGASAAWLAEDYCRRHNVKCDGASSYGHGMNLTRVHAGGCCERDAVKALR